MFARTKRLTLRPGWPEDAAALCDAIAHEAVAMKMSRLPWPYTLADAEWWLANNQVPGELHLQIIAHEADGPRLVGGTGLIREAGRVELGYWLTPGAWGRGYASEAAGAVIAIGRYHLGLKQLHAVHFLDNPASGHVLHKLGFTQTGLAKRICLARGETVDCATFALTL